MPTKEKLLTLVKEKKISKNEIKNINDLKQRFTLSFLEKDVKFDKKIYDLFSKLSKNYSLAIATNSINATLNTCIKNLKIKKFLKFYIGTDDVKNNKPHPEIYLRCLVENGFKPHETIIVEDSYVGRLAAKDACCNLLPIKFPSELSYSKIINHINTDYKNETYSILDENTLSVNQGPILDIMDNYES